MEKLRNLFTDVLLPGTSLTLTPDHLHLAFETPRQVLSSAPLGGGLNEVDNILNMRVRENFEGLRSEFETPGETLQNYAQSNGWSGRTAGLMTSASMNSFAGSYRIRDDVIVQCFLTAGLSNARRAGDTADWQSFSDSVPEPGTINIIIGTNARLSQAALVEAIMLVAESKAALLANLNVKSPVSNLTATGTGTDATIIFHGSGRPIQYCGKHVLFGEMLAETVFEALKRSLSR